MKKQGKPPKNGEERMIWELHGEKIPDKWKMFAINNWASLNKGTIIFYDLLDTFFYFSYLT